MLVKYNRPNVHTLPSFDGKKSARLMPGWNEFPSEFIELYKDHPEIKRMIEDGVIEFMDVKVKGKKVGKEDKPLHIKDMSPQDAVKVVQDTNNREMLERWRDEETRTKVKKVIEKQLKPLLPGSQEEK